jgi:hypothetical protein
MSYATSFIIAAEPVIEFQPATADSTSFIRTAAVLSLFEAA